MTRFFNTNIFFVAIIFLLAPLAAKAEDADKLSVTTYTNFLSSYVLQDVPMEISDRPVFQYGVTVAKGGWYGDIWVSNEYDEAPFTNHDGSEVDFTLGYTHNVMGIDLRGSVALFMLPKMGKLDGDIVQFDLEASKTFEIDSRNSIRPYMLVEFNPVIGQAYYGTAIQGGVAHVWKNGKWGVANKIGITHNTANGQDIFRFDSAVSYSWKGFDINLVQVKGYKGLGNRGKAKAAVGIGVSRTF